MQLPLNATKGADTMDEIPIAPRLSKKQIKEKLRLLDPRNQINLMENDGDFLRVQFVRKNGEVVIGMYKRWGWALPPENFEKKFHKRMTAPPKRIYL